MEVELKPCPFCGCAAILEGIDYWWVQCDSCGAETMGSESRQREIENWNRREEPKQEFEFDYEAED